MTSNLILLLVAMLAVLFLFIPEDHEITENKVEIAGMIFGAMVGLVIMLILL